jgi:hypothetical protein
MKFSVEGDYFELCSCDVSCNCIYMRPATHDHCDVFIGWRVTRGMMGKVDLAGLCAAMSIHSGKNMLDGGWKVALYVDERASDPQLEALTSIFTGQAGGYLAALGPLVGSVEGVTKAKFEFENLPGRKRLVVGRIFEGEIEELKGGDQKTAPVIANAPFGALPQPVRQGRSENARYRDHWHADFNDTNAFLAEFAYEG